MSEQMEQIYDVICIGAGASGLYLGYKMARDNPEKSLLILDKLDRVGGKAVSVPLDGVKYEAEGCAQRFLSTQSTVIELLNEFGLGKTEIFTTSYLTTDSDVRSEFLSRTPQPDDYKRASLDVLVNLPTIQQGSYSNLFAIDQLSGYGFGTNLMNVSTLQTKLGLTSPDVSQYYPDGGWKVLMNKLADRIRERYEIKLGTEVINVYQNDYGYLVETPARSYQCRHLVFTGNRTQLGLLGGDSTSIRSVKKLLNDTVGTDLTYLKMYFKVKNPWWSESDVGNVLNDIGPINQMYLISPDTVCMYNDSANADLLYYLVPERYRHTGIDDIQWTDARYMPRLSMFMSKYILELYGRLVDPPQSVPESDIIEFDKIAFKYTKEASLAYGPMNITPDELSQRLNNDNNLHLISDAYNPVQGWTQYCFDCVDRAYPSIIN